MSKTAQDSNVKDIKYTIISPSHTTDAPGVSDEVLSIYSAQLPSSDIAELPTGSD